MRFKKLGLTVAAAILALAAGPQGTFAQGRPDFANMDPQQIQQFIQQRLMDNCRQQLAITNDADWGVIEERLAKVVRAKMDSMANGIGGMMRFARPGGNGLGGGNGPGGGRGFPGLGPPSPETDALQSAVDGHAPASQIKAALAKYREAQQRKDAELQKAQDALREVITIRQEAILVSMSMLD